MAELSLREFSWNAATFLSYLDESQHRDGVGVGECIYSYL